MFFALACKYVYGIAIGTYSVFFCLDNSFHLFLFHLLLLPPFDSSRLRLIVELKFLFFFFTIPYIYALYRPFVIMIKKFIGKNVIFSCRSDTLSNMDTYSTFHSAYLYFFLFLLSRSRSKEVETGPLSREFPRNSQSFVYFSRSSYRLDICIFTQMYSATLIYSRYNTVSLSWNVPHAAFRNTQKKKKCLRFYYYIPFQCLHFFKYPNKIHVCF